MEETGIGCGIEEGNSKSENSLLASLASLGGEFPENSWVSWRWRKGDAGQEACRKKFAWSTGDGGRSEEDEASCLLQSWGSGIGHWIWMRKREAYMLYWLVLPEGSQGVSPRVGGWENGLSWGGEVGGKRSSWSVGEEGREEEGAQQMVCYRAVDKLGARDCFQLGYGDIFTVEYSFLVLPLLVF